MEIHLKKAIFIGAILLLILNLKVVFNPNFTLSLNGNPAIAAEVGEKKPNQQCWVGTTATTGSETKYYCGDCQKHYIYTQTGDGNCTRTISE